MANELEELKKEKTNLIIDYSLKKQVSLKRIIQLEIIIADMEISRGEHWKARINLKSALKWIEKEGGSNA